MHSTWVAPAVVVATAAPARATSGPGLAVDITSARTSPAGLAILAESRITNLSSQATTNLYVILRVELDSAAMWGGNPVATAPGWTIGSASGTSAMRTRTFSAQAQVELGPAGGPTDSQPFNPTITTNSPTVPAGMVDMTAYPFISGPPAVDTEAIVVGPT